MYDFEEERVKQFLREHKAKRVAIQLPDGLRPYADKFMATVNDAGAEAVFLAGSCYGACDIADSIAAHANCDTLIHYGHADMGLPTRLPTLYVEARMLLDPSPALERAIEEIEGKRVGLATTVQHLSYLQKASDMLRSKGIEPIIGRHGARTKYDGQILGCDLNCVKSIANQVDSFLYIGTGLFHPIGISITTEKDVITVNPVLNSFEKLSLDRERFLLHRKAMISRASTCDKFGILVSVKPGQFRPELAWRLAFEFKRSGKIAEVLVMDEIIPERIEDFSGIEALVCTACPRIAIDDADRFTHPILNPFEALVLIGRKSFKPYEFVEFVE